MESVDSGGLLIEMASDAANLKKLGFHRSRCFDHRKVLCVFSHAEHV